MHISRTVEGFTPRSAEDGVPIGAAAITGFQGANESDLLLKPKLDTQFVDHLSRVPTVAMFAEVADPVQKNVYSRDTRSVLRRALAYLEQSGIADEVLIGPEIEFYLFEGVEFRTASAESYVRIEELDGLHNSAVSGSGHRISYPSVHLACQPSDMHSDFRNTIVEQLRRHGIIPLHHHHESGPSQHEIGIRATDALSAADDIQKQKYIIQNIAQAQGKTATFMPKPLAYAPGSGLHLNISLWKEKCSLFHHESNLISEIGRYFIGGILKHVRALNVLLNSSMNSYKRLRSAFSLMNAPSYGFRNRSSLIRIPAHHDASECRIEVRFGDSAGNPYLAIAGLIMAGMDGVINKIDPGEQDEKNNHLDNALFDARRVNRATFCGSMDEAIIALAEDCSFLEAGEVFSKELLDMLIAELNRQIRVMDSLPHPNEFSMYFSS